MILLVLFLLTAVSSQYGGYYLTTPRFSTKAVAIVRSYGVGDVVGVVIFEQEVFSGSVIVHGHVRGLSTGQHGFHIHQYADITHDCTTAGPHFNPSPFAHGGLSDIVRHIGDLGNIQGNSSGIAMVNLVDDRIRLNGRYSIIGRSLVVHLLKDDLGRGGNAESLISGNAGARIACGPIGLASEEPGQP